MLKYDFIQLSIIMALKLYFRSWFTVDLTCITAQQLQNLCFRIYFIRFINLGPVGTHVFTGNVSNVVDLDLGWAPRNILLRVNGLIIIIGPTRISYLENGEAFETHILRICGKYSSNYKSVRWVWNLDIQVFNKIKIKNLGYFLSNSHQAQRECH